MSKRSALMCAAVMAALLLSPSARAENRASLTAEPQNLHIGDRLQYRVEVSTDEPVQWTAPDFDDRFDVIDSGYQQKTAGDQVRQIWWYTLSVFEFGAITLPVPEINTNTGAIEVEPVTIVVERSLKGDAGDDIRPNKPLVPPTPKKRWVLWLCGAFLGVIMAAAFYFLRKRPEMPVVMPHEQALNDLRTLRSEQLVDQGRIDEYYTRVSAIVRRYIEQRFHVDAPDMTTDEFLKQSSRAPELSSAYQTLLKKFLTQCDLVKFARYQPTADEVQGVYRTAETFVRNTQPKTEGQV